MAWYAKTACEIRESIQQRQATAVEVTHDFLSRISDVDTRIGAYTQVWTETALEQARQIDAALLRGEDRHTG